jgi:hypothetical protein
MDINRDNYEEYFLLYADNELTDSEKAAVLMFLKENKDLEAEFRLIHHTISKPDRGISLADKSFLLKGKDAPLISEKNYEEIFVLYHDNELTPQQRKETEEFLARHMSLQQEFDLIGLARLVPEEAVLFPGKKALYKKERAGKVTVMVWRSLAAALFIGFGLWLTQQYMYKERHKEALTVRSLPVKNSPHPEVVPGKKEVNTAVQPAAQNTRPLPSDAATTQQKLPGVLSQKNTISNAVVKTTVTKEQPTQEIAIQPSPATTSRQESINTGSLVTNDNIGNMAKEEIKGNNPIASLAVVQQNNAGSSENQVPDLHARNASYVADANDNSQNYVFYDVTTEEFRKTRVGGFLKKVKRVIERNNPIARLLTGDEKQVVSN